MPGRYRVRVPEETASFIRRLHPDIKKKIKAGLEEIASDPECGKALRDELAGLRSLGVGRFRIIYRRKPGKRTTEIVAVGPRKAVYKETYRLLSKRRHRGTEKGQGSQGSRIQ